MQTFTHQKWCTTHLLEEDTDGSAADVCKAAVTRGRFTVDVEDSPAWHDDERCQIVPPDMPFDVSCSAADARDLAAALIEAARLVEEGSK